MWNMKSVNYLVFFIVEVYWILSSNYVLTKELPLVVRNLKCPINKDFDACVIENGNKAIPLVAKGDPEYGIPNMVPLKISFMNLIDTPNLHINLRNIEVHGLKKVKVIDYKSDFEKSLFFLSMKVDNITVVGNYEADGKISIMPLKGKGTFSMYLKNGIYNVRMSTKIIEKNGDKYFKLTECKIDYKFEKIVFHLDNLFEGNKELGDHVNNFLNENWEYIAADFGPAIERDISKIVSDIFIRITSVVPMKNIFLSFEG
ncbi:protein takeout-like [Harmonia axyridis]|uniref:protein takeout-like n=1 Tax=Harmonia axyridis TaxID=115357 RepID=UPI001E2799BF|nr:protein takeout-like [Harmonia axyridis]